MINEHCLLISVIGAGVSGSLKECWHQNLLLKKLALMLCCVFSFLFLSVLLNLSCVWLCFRTLALILVSDSLT